MAEQQLTEEQRRELEEKLKNMSPEELREFQKQQCIFCQIIAGKIPSKIVFDDEQCVAVLDINPASPGHLLLLPKEHYAIMPQVPDKILRHLFIIAKKLSQVILKSMKVDGTNIFVANGFVAGQRAQHFMIHIIPRKGSEDIPSLQEKVLDDAARQKIVTAVRPKFEALAGIKREVKKEVPVKETLVERTAEVSSSLSNTIVEKKSPPPKKKSSRKAKAESSTEPTQDTKSNQKTKEEVSLDDIADLF